MSEKVDRGDKKVGPLEADVRTVPDCDRINRFVHLKSHLIK